MIKILLYVSNILVILPFIGCLIVIIANRKKDTGIDGFNITKDMLEEYNSINIIENRGYFTVYNIRRKVIKIASECYYGNGISDISIPLIEAGISVVHSNKNKFINFMKKIITNLKCLYVLPFLAIGINFLTYNINDAKVGIVLVAILSLIYYLFIEVKTEAIDWIEKNINKIKNLSNEDKVKVVNFSNVMLLFDKIIFLAELLMIVRFILILLNIMN